MSLNTGLDVVVYMLINLVESFFCHWAFFLHSLVPFLSLSDCTGRGKLVPFFSTQLENLGLDFTVGYHLCKYGF